MIKFASATSSYGSSDYLLPEHLFPKTLSDPIFDIPYIEEAVSKCHSGRHYELEHHSVPAYAEFNVPAYHIYMCDGIRITYICN